MVGIRELLVRAGCLTLLVVGVAAGWRYHDDIAAWWKDRSASPAPAGSPASEELAARAEGRLEALLRSPGGGELRLEAGEVSSFLRYRVVPRLPAGVTDPRIRLSDSTAVAEASVDLVRIAGGGLPDAVRTILGDSTRITATVVPSVPARGRIRLRIRGLRAGDVSVPSLMLPYVLRQTRLPVSRSDPSSLEMRVGYGLTGARVEDGTLVLTREAGPSP